MTTELAGCTILFNDKEILNKSINILATGSNTLKIKYTNTDTKITKVNVKLEISPSSDKKKINYPSANSYSVDVNKDYEIPITTFIDGKYIITYELNKQSSTRTIYIRSKKYDFVCSECGRDLTLTLDKLKLIFPDNDKLTQADVDNLNDAFKKGGFSTCKRQAHFFSQVAIESSNFTDFEEDYWYRFCEINSNSVEVGIYKVFGSQSGESYKTLYDQKFWDDNTHLEYTGSSLCSHLYKKNASCEDIKDKTQRYTDDGFTTKSRNGLNITFPTKLKKDEKGIYSKYSIPDAKKCGENLFNLVYKNKNGNNKDGDGWLFRGRGAIQVTGRENYQKTSEKANDVFKKKFDWENNPDDLKNNTEAVIYSAVAWFLRAYNPISLLDSKTTSQVTVKVNAKGEKAAERSQKYQDITTDIQLFNCEKK